MPNLVITGGSSGIGAAITLKFLENSYTVYNLDIKDNPRFRDFQNYEYHEIDVTNKDNLKETITKISQNNQMIQ